MVNVESAYTLKNEADKEKTIPYDIILINEDGDTVTFNVSYGELADDEEEQAEDQQPD